jgi:hypothetical protein
VKLRRDLFLWKEFIPAKKYPIVAMLTKLAERFDPGPIPVGEAHQA